MPYIKVSITVYKSLGYPSHREQIIVGDHEGNAITKGFVVELFKKMVVIFRYYNRVLKGKS